MHFNQVKIVATAAALSAVAFGTMACSTVGTWQQWQDAYALTAAPAALPPANMPPVFYVRDPKRGQCGQDKHPCWQMTVDHTASR